MFATKEKTSHPFRLKKTTTFNYGGSKNTNPKQQYDAFFAFLGVLPFFDIYHLALVYYFI